MVYCKVQESSQKILIPHPLRGMLFHKHKIFVIELISVSFSYNFCFLLKVLGFLLPDLFFFSLIFFNVIKKIIRL